MIRVWGKYLALSLMMSGVALQVGHVGSMPVSMDEGAQLFINRGCIGCHSVYDRPAALKPMPASDIADALYAYKSDTQGHSAMHAIATGLSNKDIANLAAFLGHSSSTGARY